jgi:hypothetical protein
MTIYSISVNKMTAGEMTNDKIKVDNSTPAKMIRFNIWDKMTGDKTSIDKRRVNKMTVDKMTVGKMTVDKKVVDKIIIDITVG